MRISKVVVASSLLPRSVAISVSDCYLCLPAESEVMLSVQGEEDASSGRAEAGCSNCQGSF